MFEGFLATVDRWTISLITDSIFGDGSVQLCAEKKVHIELEAPSLIHNTWIAKSFSSLELK